MNKTGFILIVLILIITPAAYGDVWGSKSLGESLFRTLFIFIVWLYSLALLLILVVTGFRKKSFSNLMVFIGIAIYLFFIICEVYHYAGNSNELDALLKDFSNQDYRFMAPYTIPLLGFIAHLYYILFSKKNKLNDYHEYTKTAHSDW